MSEMTELGRSRGYPVKISVRVLFSDGSVHEYEVDNIGALSPSPDEMRAQQGLPPAEMPPKWTPFQARLAALYGTCEVCGEPRDVRTIADNPNCDLSTIICCPKCR